LLATAAAIVMNTEEAARAVRALPGVSRKPIFVIPNGYDASDFTGPAPVPAGDVLSIVHTGYLHTALGHSHRRTARVRALVGGMARGVDFLPRSHVYLLRALEQVLATHPESARRIEVHFAGVLSAADEAVIRDFAYPEIVRAHGYVPHSESVRLVRSAGLLFLPMYDLPPGRRARIVPGKAYEYLASGRPILAAVPDGDARDLMEATDGVHVCRPTDVDAMAAAIGSELDRPRDQPAATLDRRELLAPYERRRLTARLAEAFDEVLAGGAAAR
jgi:glycosyltransferase involved in cell wall biosynthesis